VGVIEILTVKDAALLLKTSRQQVRRMIRSGLIPAVKVGREWRITAEAVEGIMKRIH